MEARRASVGRRRAAHGAIFSRGSLPPMASSCFVLVFPELALENQLDRGKACGKLLAAWPNPPFLGIKEFGDRIGSAHRPGHGVELRFLRRFKCLRLRYRGQAQGNWPPARLPRDTGRLSRYESAHSQQDAGEKTRAGRP